MLKGSRTYLTALGFALVAVGGYLSGEMTWPDAVHMFLTGGGLASLRAALSHETAKPEMLKPGAWKDQPPPSGGA